MAQTITRETLTQRLNGIVREAAWLAASFVICLTSAAVMGEEPVSMLSNAAIGDQRTAVVLANFADDPQEPWTAAEVDTVVFGTVNAFMVENSYNQMAITGNVLGWVTMQLAGVDCTDTAVKRESDIAISNAGFDLSAYDRVIYIVPENENCNFTARAFLGGPVAWFNGIIDPDVITHEYGHMLGLYHSNSLDCGPLTLGLDCQVTLYGDGICTMGKKGHFNAFQKQRLGWLDVVDIQFDADITLGAYETVPDANPKAARVLRNVDPVTGRRAWYYLEFRRPIGFDAWIDDASSPWELMLDGVVLHIGSDEEGDSIHLLDATPESQLFDRHDGRIPAGASYEDFHAGVEISVGSIDDSGADVSVTFFEPVNASPEAAPDSAITKKRTAVEIDVLANDSDPDMDPIGITAVTNGAHGQIVKQADGTLIYQPDSSFTGVDTFSYTIEDGFGGGAVGMVTVSVLRK